MNKLFSGIFIAFLAFVLFLVFFHSLMLITPAFYVISMVVGFLGGYALGRMNKK